MEFSSLSLNPQLLKNIQNLGFHEATAIQQQTIPIALEGKDISGLSKTGTGKTAAFLIPIIQRLSTQAPNMQALVLAPTRELALQIEADAIDLTTDMENMGTVSIVGGMPFHEQTKKLRQGARIVIGTPGRVIEMIQEKELQPNNFVILVFDEADRMFDMGFFKDMRYILDRIPQTRQIFLFSATLNFSVLNMVYRYKATPVEINVSRDQITAEGIHQVVYHLGDDEKPRFLVSLCKKITEGTVIIFVNYKERVDWLVDILNKNSIPAQGLSGLLRQDKRNKILESFRNGQFRALVATDLASRGLDIDNVSLVINYQLPEESANYVHRIGRTARAGKSGRAIALAGAEDAFNLLRIEEYLGEKIQTEKISDADLAKDVYIPPLTMKDDKGAPDNQAEERPARHQRSSSAHRHNSHRNDRDSRDSRDNRDNRDGRNNDRNRGGRYRGRSYDRQHRNERSDHQQDRQEHHKHTTPTATPAVLTGNPTIYDTVTGTMKNRSSDDSILKKISNIFGKR